MTQRTHAQHDASRTNLRQRVTVDHDLKAQYADRRQPIRRPNQTTTEPSRLMPTTPADWESFWLSRLFPYPMPKDAATALAMTAVFTWHINLFSTMQGKPGNFGAPTVVTVHTPTGKREVDTELDEDDVLPFGTWEPMRNPPPYDGDDEPYRVRPEQQ